MVGELDLCYSHDSIDCGSRQQYPVFHVAYIEHKRMTPNCLVHVEIVVLGPGALQNHRILHRSHWSCVQMDLVVF